MDLSYDDVLEILDLVENSNIEYLEVEIGTTKIVANKNAQPTGLAPAISASEGARAAEERPTPRVTPTQEAPAPAKPSPVNSPQIDESLVQVNAPVVGVFYRQSEPGAPPYVELGSKVDEGSTLGLLEVMKMFTSVTSPVEGEIVEIKAHNNDFVEFEQVLFVIRPTY